MPICFIDGPSGLSLPAKQRLAALVTEALERAYDRGDVRLFLREYPPQTVAQDGRFDEERVRPVCTLAVPPLDELAARRELLQAIDTAIRDAYQGIANTEDIVTFFDGYPLDRVGIAGKLATDVAATHAAPTANA